MNRVANSDDDAPFEGVGSNDQLRLLRARSTAPHHTADQLWQFASGWINVLVTALDHDRRDIEDTSLPQKCAINRGMVAFLISKETRFKPTMTPSYRVRFYCHRENISFVGSIDTLDFENLLFPEKPRERYYTRREEAEFSVNKNGITYLLPEHDDYQEPLQFSVLREDHGTVDPGQVKELINSILNERRTPPDGLMTPGELPMGNTPADGHDKIKSSIAAGGNIGNVNIIVAQTISRSFNTIETSHDEEKKKPLTDLAQLVDQLVKEIDQQGDKKKATKVAQQLETITVEATSDEPDEEEMKRCGNGLIEAATFVEKLAAPIASTVKVVLGLFGYTLG